MNKAGLAKIISDSVNVFRSQDEAKEAVNAVVDALSYAFKSGEDVVIKGFGTFNVKTRAEKKVANPRTGAPMLIPPRRTVTFRPARDLKSKL